MQFLYGSLHSRLFNIYKLNHVTEAFTVVEDTVVAASQSDRLPPDHC